MMLGIGQFIAPTFGANMAAAYGFRLTMDCVAISFLVFALIYFGMVGGVQATRQTALNFRKVN
jgi:hypothetical protein